MRRFQVMYHCFDDIFELSFNGRWATAGSVDDYVIGEIRYRLTHLLLRNLFKIKAVSGTPNVAKSIFSTTENKLILLLCQINTRVMSFYYKNYQSKIKHN